MNARSAFLLATTLLFSSCGDDTDPIDPEVFAGPSSPVQVRVDRYGIAHIDAANATDAHFASGYVQASTRLFQMDEMRRRALGRRAEVWPDEAEDDVLMRTLDFPRLGAENAERTRREAPRSHGYVVAWTAGVNRFIDEVMAGTQALPTGFGAEGLGHMPERWSNEDAYAIGKLIVFGNANQVETDLLATLLDRLAPDFVEAQPPFAPLEDAYILPPEERPAPLSQPRAPRIRRPLPIDLDDPGLAEHVDTLRRRLRGIQPGASNNWGIAGRHTESGRPMLAGDPHQSLLSPAVFHMQHLRSADGVLDVIGFGFVGTPAIQLGQNASIAWTGTTAFPDWMDLVRVGFDGEAVTVFGERVEVEVHEETIAVAGEDARTIDAIRVPGYGVLLPDGLSPLPLVDAGEAVLLRWTGFTPTLEAASFFALGEARTLDEFEAAVDSLTTGAFNWIFADANDIRYRSAPAVPMRAEGFDAPWRLVDGSAMQNAWNGETLPLDMLPRSEGGERGFLATANNDPYGFLADRDPLTGPFYYGTFHDPGGRAARIESELSRLIAEGPVTSEQMKAMHYDAHSPFYERLLALLEAALAARESDETLAEYRERPELDALVQELRTWDGQMLRESTTAVLMHVVMARAAQDVLLDDLSFLYAPIYDASPILAMKWALQALENDVEALVENPHATVLGALAYASDWLSEDFETRPTWGQLHVLELQASAGVFERDLIPMDGGNGTLNVARSRFREDVSEDAPIVSRVGAVYRMVIGFDESGRPDAEFQFMPGNSGEPESPHWNDGSEDWQNGVYRPLPFDDGAIDGLLETTFTLER